MHFFVNQGVAPVRHLTPSSINFAGCIFVSLRSDGRKLSSPAMTAAARLKPDAPRWWQSAKTLSRSLRARGERSVPFPFAVAFETQTIWGKHPIAFDFWVVLFWRVVTVLTALAVTQSCVELPFNTRTGCLFAACCVTAFPCPPAYRACVCSKVSEIQWPRCAAYRGRWQYGHATSSGLTTIRHPAATGRAQKKFQRNAP